MPTFNGIHMILDICTLTCKVIFPYGFLKISKFFWLFFSGSGSLKSQCYDWSLIHLFVLGRDRFFTIYICFKGTLFFNSSSKLSNKCFSLPLSTCHFRVSVRKKPKIVMCVCHFHNLIIKIMKKAVHAHNYRVFWKGLCFNYLTSTSWL